MYDKYKSDRFLLILYTGLLFTLVVSKGLNLSSLLMPFEGRDEYQYIVAAHFLDENGRRSRLEDTIPESIWSFLRSHPHPDVSAHHLQGIEARNYAGQIWDSKTKGFVDSVDYSGTNRYIHNIYQSQHPPLYYGLLVAVKRMFDLDTGDWVDVGRIMNVVFNGLTICLWCFILWRVLGRHRNRIIVFLVPLMIAVNSVVIYNAARIANDALAILVATIALALYVSLFKTTDAPTRKSLMIWSIVLGVLTGLAVLTKSTVIVLVPVLLLGLFCYEWSKLNYRGLPLLLPTLFIISYSLVAAWYHVESLLLWGNITGMQDTVRNQAQGNDLGDILLQFTALRWGELKRFMLYGYLHTGGWSGTKPDTIEPVYFLYKSMIKVTAVGFILSFFSRTFRRRVLAMTAEHWELLLLLGLMCVALIWLSLQTLAAWGYVGVAAHYGLLTFPILCLVFLGMGGWPRNITCLAGLVYVALFLWAYVLGTIKVIGSFLVNADGFADIAAHLHSHHYLLSEYPLSAGLIVEAVSFTLALGLLAYVFFTQLEVANNVAA